MNITLQYFDSCPNWKIAEGRLKAIIAERGLDVSLSYQRIETSEDAMKYSFAGCSLMVGTRSSRERCLSGWRVGHT